MKEYIQKKHDIYHDPKEFFWKNRFAYLIYDLDKHFTKLPQQEKELALATKAKIISAFNSNASLNLFRIKLEKIFSQVTTLLTQSNNHSLKEHIDSLFNTLQDSLLKIENNVIPDSYFTPLNSHSNIHIENGNIKISNKDLSIFSQNEDYFEAIIDLFIGFDCSCKNIIEDSFVEGFKLNEEEIKIVDNAKNTQMDIVSLLNHQLLQQQVSRKFKSILQYEYIPSAPNSINHQRRVEALKEAMFLFGKILSTVALFYNESKTYKYTEDFTSIDPIEMFFQAAGREISKDQISALRKCALAHVSHGLNSAEFVCLISSSVRTTFPRALIAGLNVGSGMLHGGAIEACMRQTTSFLNSDQLPEKYVQELINANQLIYGFGHRIHKITAETPPEIIASDPRVHIYFDACRQAFPNKADVIEKLYLYAREARKQNPTLGANTDFAASVLFHCLEFPPEVARGFFTVFRTPGACSQIINELSVKGNSRRPPFAHVIPYI
ncbi:citrate/2-methylcitrate synthase [Parashewanella tropica]|uniref:citrate/2-methylcitrate synthase n=1 Tax=Parashewanella tropica TaxID=2547970 RepID=UPI0010599C27|nr:citrate/2-methylcitrate synthase [Parashewanella tropica]